MNNIAPLTFLIVFLAFTASASAYNFTSVYQDDGTSDHEVITPSFYWPGSCVVNITLLATASHTGSFNLNNEWYSPNDNLLLTGNPPAFTSDITCQSLGTGSASNSLNDFYEAKTITTSSATSTETWVRAQFECETDENLNILYSNTAVLDSHSHFPYGYLDHTGGYCAVGSPGTFPSITTRLNSAIDYITERYDTECSSQDLEIAEIGGAPATCAQNRFFASTFWYLVPFTSGSAGIVNISILEQITRESGFCSMSCVTNNTYLYDTVTNSTTDLGTSMPLNQDLVLQRDRDYWLLIGTECIGGTGGGGSCTIDYNHTEYNISIFAYEPDWTCTEYGECIDDIQQRICTDPLGLVPQRIFYRSCFEGATVRLGFEDSYDANVYICTKGEINPLCTDLLQTTTAKYPVGWTVIGDFDATGTNRANNIEVSQDFNRNSIKMWYIPPKESEPVADSPTKCGNATTGRFPEIAGPFNETLFISTNVTFESPYPEFTYLIRKCDSPVIQYDYTGAGWGFNCGKRCYAQNCTEEPEGRYAIAVTRLAGNTISEFPSFSMFNVTDNVTSLVTDGSITTYATSTFEPGFIVNSTSNIFTNGSRLNFLLNLSDSVPKNLCVYESGTNNVLATELISVVDTILTFNITLVNISSTIDEINISSCGGADDVILIYIFNVENFQNLTTQETLRTYYDDAPSNWENRTLDLSRIGLQAGLNYTISIAVNPQNNLYPYSHCVYISDFRANFRATVPPPCASSCEGLTRVEAILQDSVCIKTSRDNSPKCVTDSVSRALMEQIIAGFGGGDVTDNSTCIDLDGDGTKEALFIYSPSTADWDIITNSEVCLELNATLGLQLTLYDPPEFVVGILLGFGLTQEAWGYVWFFFSIFMLINYVALGLGIGITVYLIPLTQPRTGQQVGYDNSFIPFLSTVLIIIIGALFSGFYPLEIGLPIVVGLGLLLWKQMETMVGGHGGR